MKRREFLKAAGATALVVSMSALTGCGGTGGSGNGTGGNGGNGGGAGGDENPGTGDGDGDNGGGSGTGTTDPVVIQYKDSKTAKYFAQKGVTPTNFYMEGNVKWNYSGKILLARSGENVRFRKYFDSVAGVIVGDNILGQGNTFYKLSNTKQYKLLDDEPPTAAGWADGFLETKKDLYRRADGFFVYPTEDTVRTVKKMKVSVGNVWYDAEEMEIAIGRIRYTRQYCFIGDEMKCIVDNNNNAVTTITTLRPNPEASLMKIPEGYVKLDKDAKLNYDCKF